MGKTKRNRPAGPAAELDELAESTCRHCGCTELDGCAAGCSWVDCEETVCSQCVLKRLDSFVFLDDRRGPTALIDLPKGLATLGIDPDGMGNRQMLLDLVHDFLTDALPDYFVVAILFSPEAKHV